MTVDVAIVGGGVSGLAAAYDLSRAGHDVVVLERQVRAGGNAQSDRVDGFLMEHGPTTMNPTVPESHAFSRALGLADQEHNLGSGVKRRYLVASGSLKALGIHPLAFMLSNYLSVGGRLRMLGEGFIGRKSDDIEETVAQFVTRRFGAEFAERVMDPLAAGLYAGNATELSASAVFPRLIAMEEQFGSVTRAVMNATRRRRMPGRKLFSWSEGIGQLPKALAEQLSGQVRKGIAVRTIARNSTGYRLDLGEAGSVEARSVVIATQPHVAAGLIEPLDDDGAAALREIDAPPLAVVYLGYRRHQIAHPLDGLGFLAAAEEGRLINGAQFSSTMFDGRAPDGHVAISAYVGGARNPDLARLSTPELIDLAATEFRELLGAKGDPVHARVRHWPLGLPQYRLGHGTRVATLNGLSDRLPGLHLTGNYLAGPSVAVCLSQARTTAARVSDYLKSGDAQLRTDQHLAGPRF